MSIKDAHQMILENAKLKFSKNERLTQVEKVILKEHITRIRAKLDKLELKHEASTATKEDYVEIFHCRAEIEKFGKLT